MGNGLKLYIIDSDRKRLVLLLLVVVIIIIIIIIIMSFVKNCLCSLSQTLHPNGTRTHGWLRGKCAFLL